MKQESISQALSGTFAKRPASVRFEAVNVVDSDDAIIAAVREGDTESFGILVRKYEDFVYTLVFGMIRTNEPARDISQEVFLRAYKGIRRFEHNSSFKTWLYRIAYNTTLAHISREKSRSKALEENVHEPKDDTYKNRSLKMTLEKLIGMLKPDLRAVVILHYYDDLKYEEIAEVLACPIGTVKIRLYRAKYELKRMWDKHAV